MKKSYIIIVMMLVCFTASAEWKPLINKGGVYKLFDENDVVSSTMKYENSFPKGSFNYYTYCLGYTMGEVTSYVVSGKAFIALNTFNNEVLFVLPLDENQTSLMQKEVDEMMEKYEPSMDDFLRNLNSGLKKKCIRQSYVEKSLGIKAKDNIIRDEIHGYTYVFNNGIMVEYNNNSGYSDDVIFIKEHLPKFFDIFESNARKYYVSSSAIVAYVNGQCRYLMKIPQSYINKAPNDNYALLYCILEEGMSLDEFNLLVPEAKISSTVGNFIVMAYGNYIFTFKDKILVKD